MTTRSMVLARWASTAAGNSPVFQPPAGFCWILKTATIRNGSAATANPYIWVSNQTGTVVVASLGQPISSGQSLSVQTWTMIMPTDLFYISTDQASTSVWVSGAQLPFP